MTLPDDAALPGLRLALDPALRAAALGASTEIVRVRWKPGTALVAAVRATGSEVPLGWPHGMGWIACHAAPEKHEKTRDRAARVGVRPTDLGDGALAGPAHADRAVASRMAKLLQDVPRLLEDSVVVRYNPHRRLVLRLGERAIRVTAHDSAGDRVAAGLARAGLPVLAPARMRTGVTATPWWGDGDLVALRDTGIERLAGAALAGVHRADARLAGRATAARDRAGEAARAIARLAPHLAPRAARIADRLTALEGDPVLVHGDFSPDQVLTDGSSVRMIDFDRAARGPAGLDLGSYLAAGGSAAMLDGYRDAGGRVDEAALPAWRALALLQRAVEPFRTGADDWPLLLAETLTRCEKELG